MIRLRIAVSPDFKLQQLENVGSKEFWVFIFDI